MWGGWDQRGQLKGLWGDLSTAREIARLFEVGAEAAGSVALKV